MNLKDIDLNLLLVFHQLMVERRVNAVADKLGLSQPAVSNALGRLRRLLGDELFLRTATGMEPTPYAVQLAEPTAYALTKIHCLLSARSGFDASSSDRKFKLMMTDLDEICLMPKLMNILAKVAPGVSVSAVRNTSVNLRDEIEAGHVDMAVGSLPRPKTGFLQRTLFKQRYVCMFRAGHSLDKPKISLNKFQSAKHVTVASADTGHAKIDEFTMRKGVQRHIMLTVPNIVTLGHILATTDMIATVPERYAIECATPFGLKYVAHPLSIPEISTNVIWHAKYQSEPENQWFRNLLLDAFAA